MPIIAAIPDEERRLMRKEAQQTHDKNHAKRLIAMLMLHQGMTVTDILQVLPLLVQRSPKDFGWLPQR